MGSVKIMNTLMKCFKLEDAQEKFIKFQIR